MYFLVPCLELRSEYYKSRPDGSRQERHLEACRKNTFHAKHSRQVWISSTHPFLLRLVQMLQEQSGHQGDYYCRQIPQVIGQ